MAERRISTVLMLDVVGSTHVVADEVWVLSQTLDVLTPIDPRGNDVGRRSPSETIRPGSRPAEERSGSATRTV